jgi:hypothetical protein
VLVGHAIQVADYPNKSYLALHCVQTVAEEHVIQLAAQAAQVVPETKYPLLHDVQPVLVH